MKKLTIEECFCILHTGWSTDEERELRHIADEQISLHARKLHLDYQRDELNKQLEETSGPTNKQIDEFVTLLRKDNNLGINENKKTLITKTIEWLDNLKK